MLGGQWGGCLFWLCLKLRSFWAASSGLVNLNQFHSYPIDAKAVLRKSANKLNFSLSGNNSAKSSAEKPLDPTFVILKLDHSLALKQIQRGIWHMKDSTLLVPTLHTLSEENAKIEIVPSILKAHFLTVPPKPLSMEKEENNTQGVQDFWVVTTSNGSEIKDLWDHMLRSNTKFVTKAETKSMPMGLVCFSNARDALMICEHMSSQKNQTGQKGPETEIMHIQANPLIYGFKVRAYSRWEAVVEWWSITGDQMTPAAVWKRLKATSATKVYKAILQIEPMAYRQYENFGAINKAYEEMRPGGLQGSLFCLIPSTTEGLKWLSLWG